MWSETSLHEEQKSSELYMGSMIRKLLEGENMQFLIEHPIEILEAGSFAGLVIATSMATPHTE